MPSPTTARGLLGIFLRGADPPATDQPTTTLHVRLPKSLSLQAISTDRAVGRGPWGGTNGRRIPRDGEGGSAKAGGSKGRTSGKHGVETRTTEMAVMTVTTALESGRRGRHDQVSSDGAGGEYRAWGGAKGESAEKSAGWSGEESDGTATDEGATTTEGAGWDVQPRTATAGGTRRSGADRRLDDAIAGRGNSRKASSAATDEAGAQSQHGARPVQRGRAVGWWENLASKSSGVQGDYGGRVASGVAHDSSVVGDEEGASMPR